MWNFEQYKYAWCAGLFDGEGCVSISCIKPGPANKLLNNSYHLVVKLTMTDEATVRKFHGLVGVGTVHMQKATRHSQAWSWVASARLGERVLKHLTPYLFTKKKEAKIGLAFMKLPDVKRGGPKGSVNISEGLLLKKHTFYVECANAKQRTRFRKTPLTPFTFTPSK